MKSLLYFLLAIFGVAFYGLAFDGVTFQGIYAYLIENAGGMVLVVGTLDMTTFDTALKEHYTSDEIQNLVYPDNPLFAIMPKMERFGGRNLPIPLKFGNPNGRSATFATAQANKSNTKIESFLITRVKDYSLGSIDGETIEASEGDANAFMTAATTEIDGTLEAAVRSLAVGMYRNGAGTIGRIANAAVNTPILTLSDPEDITNFELGMRLTLSALESGAVRAGSLLIIGVDRGAGTITLSGDIDAGVAAAAQNDFIQVQGDFLLKISGLESWVPAVAPGATSFFGVDRTQDVTRLGGVRFDGSALPIEEALIDGVTLASREGGKTTHMFMNYNRWGNLEKALGSKVQYVDEKSFDNAQIGFRGIQINGPRGTIKVIPDQNCPDDTAFGLDMSTWKLYSLGKAVKILMQDGNKMLREAAADAVEIRTGGYYQMGCNAPGKNVNIKLA